MTAVHPGFDAKAFLKLARTGLAELSVMQRMARVSECLHAVLALDFEASLPVLRALAPRLNSGFVSMCLPHYVATYGAERFELSMDALKYFTAFGSSEFAIRHFLRRDLERSLKRMHEWSLDANEHVRRLASEGCRPRLPWSFRLESIQAEPRLAAAILDNLKADPSLYVRKSVANHLNDITKDHPEWVLDLIESWSLDNKHTAWIARHALRSLIKQGNQRALAIIGASGKPEVEIIDLQVNPPVIDLGKNHPVLCRQIHGRGQPAPGDRLRRRLRQGQRQHVGEGVQAQGPDIAWQCHRIHRPPPAHQGTDHPSPLCGPACGACVDQWRTGGEFSLRDQG
jgi:3-methyladenine DNA glycosylase AlkC